MIYKPDAALMRDRSKEIINARNWAIGVITALLGMGMFLSEIQRIRQISFDVMNCAYLILFAVTGVLVFFWIWATQKELDLMFEWLDPKHYEPPSSIKETLLILTFGIFLVMLLFTSRNPLWYAAAFSAYSLILIPVGGIYMLTLIGEGIDASKERIRGKQESQSADRRIGLYSQGIDVIDHYYRKRPTKARLVLILAASLLGLALATAWRFTGLQEFGVAAYAVFISTVIVSEAVITRWRIIRDAQLGALAADI